MTEQAKPKRPRAARNQGARKPRIAAAAVIADERLRQERAYQLRMMCATFQQIADSKHPKDPERNLYASPSAAREAFLLARDRHAGVSTTAEMREEWKLRNEAIISSLMPTCLDRNHKDHHWAIDRYTRLFSEHARMLGLFQDKLMVTPGETDLEKALRELAAEVTAAAGGEPVPAE